MAADAGEDCAEPYAVPRLSSGMLARGCRPDCVAAATFGARGVPGSLLLRRSRRRFLEDSMAAT